MRAVLGLSILLLSLGQSVVLAQTAAAVDSQQVAVPAKPAAASTITVRNTFLQSLELGGTAQLKGLYHNALADRDADKQWTLTLRRFRLDLEGAFDQHFGFRGEFLLESNAKALGVDAAYLSYTLNDAFKFRGGKLKRAFSQEAMMSSKTLYTVERGDLYQTFLNDTNGYAGYDVGLAASGTLLGGMLTYEGGVFNGKQSDAATKSYSGQQYETTDKALFAKDVALRLTVEPSKMLKLGAALSTKTAQDKTNPSDFSYGMNTAYEIDADFHLKQLRAYAEVATGDNHQSLDSKILAGSATFLGFYGMVVWHEDYTQGRASELLVKMEGLDPDAALGSGSGTDNDAKLRYTLGVNYYFTPRISVLADYAILQPITDVAGADDLVHDLDMMWRMNF